MVLKLNPTQHLFYRADGKKKPPAHWPGVSLSELSNLLILALEIRDQVCKLLRVQNITEVVWHDRTEAGREISVRVDDAFDRVLQGSVTGQCRVLQAFILDARPRTCRRGGDDAAFVTAGARLRGVDGLTIDRVAGHAFERDQNGVDI